VRRSSDNTTMNIGGLSAGGYANAAAQDSFCAGTSCVITIIYDQSGQGNNLTPAPAGGYVHTPDSPANAIAVSATIAGHKVYGVYITSGVGYRDDTATGTATGDNPEGEYAIFDGTHYNGGCCFDYGNAEKTNNDDGNGTMETINFGNTTYWGHGSGSGPWVMADLENGLWPGGNAGNNTNNLTITDNYVTAMVKGEPNQWAIKAGNAQSGGLTTMWNGSRPTGYNPMHKEGAIVLGIGGDNSDSSVGTFFEGAMTSGYPSDATDNAIQASIVATGYGSTIGTTPTPTPTPITNGSGYAINAGGAAVGSFAADELYNGGTTYSTTSTITTSGVTNPAPQSVYQTERYGNFTYTLPNLKPGAAYTVRLHESENYWTASGQRTFNVAINGQQALSNFDIYAAAGAADKAIVEQFNTTADSTGQIAIQFTSVVDNAKVDGIEVIPASTATPTPTPTTVPT